MWSLPPMAGPLFRASTQVRIRLLSPRPFSESGQSSTASSCRTGGAGLTLGVTDCQPRRRRALSCTALFQTLALSTCNCQEGFLLKGEHGFTFSVLRHKSMRQLETGSQLHSEQNFTEHQQTGHAPQSLTSGPCLFYFFVFFISVFASRLDTLQS